MLSATLTRQAIRTSPQTLIECCCFPSPLFRSTSWTWGTPHFHHSSNAFPLLLCFSQSQTCRRMRQSDDMLVHAGGFFIIPFDCGSVTHFFQFANTFVRAILLRLPFMSWSYLGCTTSHACASSILSRSPLKSGPREFDDCNEARIDSVSTRCFRKVSF